MPYLYYGNLEPFSKPKLFSKELREIESKIFDKFKLDDLAPEDSAFFLAVIRHVYDHTALAWWNKDGYQQAIFLPGLFNERDAILLARETWPNQIPGPLLFRIANEGEIYEL